jgi:spore coat polysaccharide biosynthesis protein SpsF (cytidylyltransferase family)
MTLMLKRPDKFKVLNIKTPNEKIRRPELRLTVDTQEDLDVIQKIYNVFNGNPPELAKIIQWLDLNPLVKNTNAHIIPTQIDSSINFRHKGDLV